MIIVITITLMVNTRLQCALHFFSVFQSILRNGTQIFKQIDNNFIAALDKL